MQSSEVMTLPVQVFSNIKTTAMVVLELSHQIDDIVLPVAEGDERLTLLDALVISLREHAKVLLDEVRLSENSSS